VNETILVICLFFLICCAVAVARSKAMMPTVVLFGAFSLVMSVVWQLLNAPDIAITEAAVGVCSTVLMVAAVSHLARGKQS
jgi:energy-converting hydrogenase B subunit D